MLATHVGIRLPKPLIEEIGLTDEVKLRTRNGAIVITPQAAREPDGVGRGAERLRNRDEDRLLDPPTSTRFDEEEWEWEW